MNALRHGAHTHVHIIVVVDKAISTVTVEIHYKRFIDSAIVIRYTLQLQGQVWHGDEVELQSTLLLMT